MSVEDEVKRIDLEIEKLSEERRLIWGSSISMNECISKNAVKELIINLSPTGFLVANQQYLIDMLNALPAADVRPLAIRPEEDGCNFCRCHEKGGRYI